MTTARPLTPPEVRELLEQGVVDGLDGLAQSLDFAMRLAPLGARTAYDTVPMRIVDVERLSTLLPILRATLERYAELAEDYGARGAASYEPIAGRAEMFTSDDEITITVTQPLTDEQRARVRESMAAYDRELDDQVEQ